MKTRLQKTVLNSSVSVFIFVLRLIMSFLVRSFFIQYLGIEYLGLNGLFTNILSFLSLAELGFGTSIIYELYEPLAIKDKKALSALMNLYKKSYMVIGISVGILGVLIIPFLHLFIEGSNVSNVYYIYILFLINSVVSYFFTYKKSLLNADQKNYVVVIIEFSFFVALSISQIISLILFNNFIIYLILQIIATIGGNIVISFFVSRKYKDIFAINPTKTSSEIRNRLKRNIIGNFSSQIGSVLVLATDNIMISYFIGLATVGKYANYTMIITAIRGITSQITGAVTPSLGNAITEKNKRKELELFKIHLFINSSIVYFISVTLVTVMNPFIELWVGKDFLFSDQLMLLIVIQITLQIYLGTCRTFIAAYGIFWQQRWKSIIEGLINILLSLVLVKSFNLGISGIILGTILSTILVIFWYEPYLVFKYGLKTSSIDYAKKTIIFFIKLSIAITLGLFLKQYIPTHSFIAFIIGVFCTFLCNTLVYVILFSYEQDFRNALYFVKKLSLNRSK
ncbi:MAG: oligosaccharide flippase family protein [Enterococcus casseliflavus]|jgi:Membrane protein involved in the export of O-antigen and teichoic acid|nr:oligosaccharide flippase family protein [Enterococcus casseliflavus]